MRELAPEDIRAATLTRRLRGYDREETDELLARIARSYANVYNDRARLSEEVVSLSAEREERDTQSQAVLETLGEQLLERDRRIADLEAQIAWFEQERSQQLKDLDRIRDELSGARRVEEGVHAQMHEYEEQVASRFALREKALVAQIAMLVSQLNDEDATQAISRESRALPERADRAAAALLRLDRVVETLERESRREAEMTLKKARERAEEIVRSAERRKRHLEAEASRPRAEEEYDPVAALTRIEQPVASMPVPDDSDKDMGEAFWTSRAAFGEAPEPSK
jgi:DivIVA domain-containing protein